MREILHIILIATGLVLWGQKVSARIIHYGSGSESISLPYGISTIFRFHDEVKTISQASGFYIKPADPNDPNYRILTIRPRTKYAKSKITFILTNESVVSLQVHAVDKKSLPSFDNFIDFKPKEKKLIQDGKHIKGIAVTELELMKAMIREDKIIGYHDQAMSRRIDSGHKNISTRLIRTYSGPKFIGYIFRVINHTKDKKFAIDLKSLTFGRPNTALLSQVDHKILAANQGSLVRIVTKASSVYHALHLPMAVMPRKK